MKTRTFCTLLLTAALACCWTACSDKENDEFGEKDLRSRIAVRINVLDRFLADVIVANIAHGEYGEQKKKFRAVDRVQHIRSYRDRPE